MPPQNKGINKQSTGTTYKIKKKFAGYFSDGGLIAKICEELKNA